MPIIVALLSGLLFGFGLIIAGMADPAKVVAFLDLAGHWDPSLALVMIGAIGIAFLPYQWAQRHTQSLLKINVNLPASKVVDPALIIGGMVFGIGWGLAGICPGPALVLLGAGSISSIKGLVFFGAMLVGMILFEYLIPKPRR